MSKLITEHPFRDGAPVVVEDIQANHKQLADGVSNIESRQLPRQCVGRSHLSDFEFYDFPNSRVGQTTLRSPFNTWVVNHDISEGLHDPWLTVQPESIYTAGWNQLYLLDGDGTLLHSVVTLPPTPGIVNGGACVDSELRCSASNPLPLSGTDQPYPNRDLWWELAVFANGNLVGQGPRLYAGRHSVFIPFAFFSDSGEVALDLRVRVYFGQQQFKDATSRNAEPLAFHSCQLWARATSH